MKEKVFENIEKYKLIEENDRLVVGVSGGHDSMALLHILNDYREKLDFELIVAHVNHGVRGKEAKRDQEFVKEISKKLGLEYYSTQVDMVQYGIEQGISDEEAGRELRYGFFNDILGSKEKGKIAVAHNKNDQAETLIMRILRGTGIEGLTGMDFKTSNIIRPILNVGREEIESYIEDNNIGTVLDSTNEESIYTRNRIRLEVIPYLEKYFNPNLIDTLWRLSETSKIENDFLDKYAKQSLDEVLISSSNDSIVISIERFMKLHLAMKQRVIRLAIERLYGNLQGYSEQHILSVIDLIEQEETGKEIHLPNDILARIDYNKFILEFRDENTLKDYEYKLNEGENVLEEIGLTVKVSILNMDLARNLMRKDNMSIFDYDKVKGDLYIRNRRNGDRFTPLGMKGSKKIKDYFIDEKISKEKRDKIPIITDEENIIWVMGYRMSELYKVKKDTKKALVIEYIRGV